MLVELLLGVKCSHVLLVVPHLSELCLIVRARVPVLVDEELQEEGSLLLDIRLVVLVNLGIQIYQRDIPINFGGKLARVQMCKFYLPLVIRMAVAVLLLHLAVSLFPSRIKINVAP